jgi:hypothetical protein
MKTTFYKAMIRIMFVLSLILLLVVLFSTKISNKHWEDGSGIISISYCIPGGLCNRP